MVKPSLFCVFLSHRQLVFQAFSINMCFLTKNIPKVHSFWDFITNKQRFSQMTKEIWEKKIRLFRNIYILLHIS